MIIDVQREDIEEHVRLGARRSVGNVGEHDIPRGPHFLTTRRRHSTISSFIS